MNLYRPLFWPNAPTIDHAAPFIHLADLLPALNSVAVAYFHPLDTLRPGQRVRLIWCPPVSDLNGWTEQPSEIVYSQLLDATVAGHAEPTHALHRGLCGYHLEILACTPLLPTLKALPPVDCGWRLDLIGTPHGEILTWDEVRWSASAQVEGLTYLAGGTSAEAHLELLLEEHDGQLHGLLSLQENPGGSHIELGRSVFTVEERRAIKRALAMARPLQDSQAAYLLAV